MAKASHLFRGTRIFLPGKTESKEIFNIYQIDNLASPLDGHYCVIFEDETRTVLHPDIDVSIEEKEREFDV